MTVQTDSNFHVPFPDDSGIQGILIKRSPQEEDSKTKGPSDTISTTNQTDTSSNLSSSSTVTIAGVGNNNPFDAPGFDPAAVLSAIILLMQNIVNKAQQTKSQEQSEQIDNSVQSAVAENAAGQADIQTMQHNLTAEQHQQIVNLATDVVAGGLSLADAMNSGAEMVRTSRVSSGSDDTKSITAAGQNKTKDEPQDKQEDGVTLKSTSSKMLENKNGTEEDPANVTIDASEESSTNSLTTSTDKNINNLKTAKEKTNSKSPNQNDNDSDSKMAQKQKIHDEQKQMHAESQQNRVEDGKIRSISQQHAFIGSVLKVLTSENTLAKNWETSAIEITKQSANIDSKTKSVEETFAKEMYDAMSQRFQAMASSQDTMLQAVQAVIPNLIDALKDYNNAHSQQNQTAVGG